MPTDEPRRIEMIHIVRGLASVSVAWFHLTSGWSDWVGASGSYCWLGVEVFFVISGFVIPYSISKTYDEYSVQAFGNFISRRLLRIEVPYAVSILLVIALTYASWFTPGFRGSTPNFTAAQITANIFYIAPWTRQVWMQPVYWTLAYEFAFYLTVGMSFSVLFKQRSHKSFIFAAVVLILATMCKVVSPLVLLFVMGASVFKFQTQFRRPYIGICIGLICAIVVATFGGTAIAFTGLVTAVCIALGQGFRVNGIFGRAFAYLGTVSFSLYLMHVPIGGRVVNLAARFSHGQLEHLIVTFLALAASLIAAHLFYITIERPAQLKAKHLVMTVQGTRRGIEVA